MLKESIKGRFGYHSADYETYKKLKFLYKHYWQAVYDCAKFDRWDRKTVYQTGPEPQVCPYYHVFSRKPIPYCRKGVNGVRWVSHWISDHWIVEAYHNSRTPKASPEAVKPLEMSQEKIDRAYEQVKKWVELG